MYLERESGVIDIRHRGGTESLFFRRGELYLDRDHDRSVRVAPLLAAVPAGKRAADSAELQLELSDLARVLVSLSDPQVEVKSADSMVVELTGPFPTVTFLLALINLMDDERELVALVGGPNVRFRNSNDTPALDQLPPLDKEMAGALVCLETPTSVNDLLRGAGGDRLVRARGLVKLWAVGLAVAVDGPGFEEGQELLSPKMLAGFVDRITKDLQQNPLELETESHRAQLAEMLRTLGHKNHYELLGLEPRSSSDEVFGAYHRVARLVHPVHADQLGLQGKETAMQVLFERATEAYLILSDPRRRASYNTVAGIQIEQRVEESQREAEKRSLAKQNYRRASTCLAEMDYSQAIDLLKEAVRMDPRPEYYVRLGVAQSKNPHWRPQALISLDRAREMAPDDAGVLVAYGSLLETMDRIEDARRQYQAALELMPDHVGALDAIERLGGQKTGASGGNFRSLFKSGRTSGTTETTKEEKDIE